MSRPTSSPEKRPDAIPSSAALGPLLSVVIPAYNEQDAIAGVVEEVGAALPDAEIIVVDDGSTDATFERVRQVRGCRILRHRFNTGYGAAIKSGMRAATRRYVAWFDADREHRVEDLVAITETIHKEGVAAVFGQRPGRMEFSLRYLGKFLIYLTARSLKVSAGRDLNCGLRVFRRDVILRYLPLLPNGYSASVTSLMIMLERGYPVCFRPVVTKRRVGESKVAFRDGLSALGLVLRVIMLFAPIRIFLGSGLFLLACGLIYSAVVAAIMGEGLPVAGVLASIFGLLLCMLGLIADQISQIRLNAFDSGLISDVYEVEERPEETRDVDAAE